MPYTPHPGPGPVHRPGPSTPHRPRHLAPPAPVVPRAPTVLGDMLYLVAFLVPCLAAACAVATLIAGR